MKNVTLILGSVLLLALSTTLLSAMPGNTKKNTEAKKRMTILAYCPTGNPTSDWIYVHLWNPNHNYNFSVPPGAGTNYPLGQIADECDYSVTLTSGGGPHTMQFYWFYASNTTSATQSGGMCLTCGSCPTLSIYN